MQLWHLAPRAPLLVQCDLPIQRGKGLSERLPAGRAAALNVHYG
jgi:hypothetical protein